MIGAVSGARVEDRRNDGFSGRDALITGIATGVLGAAGVGLGALLATTPSTHFAMSSRMGMLIGGGAAAALTANYLIGWSLTN